MSSRDWQHRAQQLRGDIKIHEAIANSTTYDQVTRQQARDYVETEKFLLAEAEFHAAQ